MEIKTIETKTFTDIDGVFAGALCAGIKEGNTTKADLAYISVPEATASAGVYTKNKFRAPCLDYSEACLKGGTIKGIIINSGNANAATGSEGYKNAERTAEIAAKYLRTSTHAVAVASTGIIGVQLPMARLEAGLNKLLQNPKQRSGSEVATAIMTTDLYKKEIFVEGMVDGKKVAVAGIAKGAGMIAPNMGTMLAFLVTDANVSPSLLQQVLASCVDDSFNMISVDTDTSTNDMALMLSTGAVAINEKSEATVKEFHALVFAACLDLAKKIARDGEGATKLIETTVVGAASLEDARIIAMNIINSPLIKCAVHGADPNWGRVAMAIGKDPSRTVNPALVEIQFGGESVFKNGAKVDFSRDRLVEHLKSENVKISVNLNLGSFQATAWGCDLTHEYVNINTDYS